jgi:hypothetical protein
VARSRDAKQGKSNRWIIAIPLIAVAVIAAVFVVSILPPPSTPAVMNFSDKLLISVNFANGTKDAYVAPTRPIGEAGGFWATHQYDAYGVDNHYPLYMDNPTVACPVQHACTFNVKSNVMHNYTLADFMAVWGYPVVSMNNTFSIARSGNYAWELCIGPTGSAVPNLAWGAMVLSPNLDITLTYYDTVNGFGCA